ncbi:unnamed protein product [Paramecium pentaurelia]|uniref:Uncharacterized protein n=1 Tax=Paramecium pentaurelia TaxID=43138 RepID=A0A8S1XZG4_9CILI|nr:unnamed protein product [Paramecium pentaurelia]
MMIILIFSKLFSKGLYIQQQQENIPDRQAVIRLQTPIRPQKTTKFMINKVFFINNIVKYYLAPYFAQFLIPSTNTDKFLAILFFMLRQQNNWAITNKLQINTKRAKYEVILFVVVDVLKFTIYKIDAKVNSQKLDVQILIIPEQIKYQQYFRAILQIKNINLTILNKKSF